MKRHLSDDDQDDDDEEDQDHGITVPIASTLSSSTTTIDTSSLSIISTTTATNDVPITIATIKGSDVASDYTKDASANTDINNIATASNSTTTTTTTTTSISTTTLPGNIPINTASAITTAMTSSSSLFDEKSQEQKQQPGESTSSAKKIRKTCENCARSKVKCSSSIPKCFRCESHGWTCTYSEERKRGRKKHNEKYSEETLLAIKSSVRSVSMDTSKNSSGDPTASATTASSFKASPKSDSLGYQTKSKINTNNKTTSTSSILAARSTKLKKLSDQAQPSPSSSDSQSVYGSSSSTISTDRSPPFNLGLMQTTSSTSANDVIHQQILQRIEKRYERMTSILFHHLISPHVQCSCHGSSDVYSGSPFQLSYKIFKVNRQFSDGNYQHNSDLYERDYHLLMANRAKFTQAIDFSPKELFFSTLGPSPDLVFRILVTGHLSNDIQSLSIGNDSFALNRQYALNLDVPTLRINVSVQGITVASTNKQFNTFFGYSQEEFTSILSSPIFNGSLPWGADVLSVLMSSDDDLLAYIHNLSSKFHHNSVVSSNFVREGWVESVYRFSSKNDTDSICILRAMIRELVTVCGISSEIYFQFFPSSRNTQILQSKPVFRSSIGSTSSSSATGNTFSSSSSSAHGGDFQHGISSILNPNLSSITAAYEGATQLLQNSGLTPSAASNRKSSLEGFGDSSLSMVRENPMSIYSQRGLSLSSSLQGYPIQLQGIDHSTALSSDIQAVAADFDGSRPIVHMDDVASNNIFAGLSWSTGLPPGWQDTIPGQQSSSLPSSPKNWFFKSAS